MSNNINYILIHVLCDEVQIEKRIFAFDDDKFEMIKLQTPKTNRNAYEKDDENNSGRFDITLYHPDVKLLGDYSKNKDEPDILSLSNPLYLFDWRNFINQKYENQKNQLYTLIVS